VPSASAHRGPARISANSRTRSPADSRRIRAARASTEEALERLVQLAEAAGNEDQAAEWQEKLDEAKKAAAPQAPKK
jgi:hypothetical protein